MAKKMDEKRVLNELHGESAFFAASPDTDPVATAKQTVSKRSRQQPGSDHAGQATDTGVEHSDAQPVDQSTTESTATPAEADFDMSPVLPRPKSFYITQQQDEDLDTLVKALAKALEGKVGQKIDRSTVTRLIFEEISLTQRETVKRLAARLTRRLVSQLTG